MSPPERFPPDDLREWLNRAKSNLAMANNRIPDAYLEDLCFEAQQAANMSKSKAVNIQMLPCILRLRGSPSNWIRKFWFGVAPSGRLRPKPQHL